MPISAAERAEILANLFPGSVSAIDDWDSFPWHRYRQRVTAGWPQSSQALAIDVFGFLRTRPQGERDAACGVVADILGLPKEGPWTIALEVNVGRDLLGEPRPTQLDALAMSPTALVVIECKFTETGGACSRPGPAGACGGRYAREVEFSAKADYRCALTAKAIRYWDHIPAIFAGLAADRDHDPCPFASERYQWMRNLAVARAMHERDRRPAGLLVAFADGRGFPTAEKDWGAFQNELAPGTRFAALSYQDLLVTCTSATVAARGDAAEWQALLEHVTAKIAQVAKK